MIVLKRFSLSNPEGEQGEQVDVGGKSGGNSNPQRQQQSQEVTSRTLMIQQMRLQRQLIQTQQAKRKLEQQERLAKTRQLGQQQRIEAEKNMREDSNNLRVKAQEKESGKASNTSLYKSRSVPNQPVSMPK